MHIVEPIQVYRVSIEGIIYPASEFSFFFANLHEHFMACRILSRADAQNGVVVASSALVDRNVGQKSKECGAQVKQKVDDNVPE
jgi:hypothetical protein